ncbi:MAG: cellulase N-terminal Ig-like domain-containing protein, partial [Ignavibacteria bacterium]|nr:cellulase N-terminal Ig-like domain-containing protein [Ignavibacteria bacterium]
MIKKNLLQIIFVFISLLQMSCNAAVGGGIFIRANQVGFLPADIKTATIMSKSDLSNSFFTIVDAATERNVYKNKIDRNRGNWGKYSFTYQIDFSGLTTAGVYYIA